MAIKVGDNVVIQNDRSADFQSVNPGAYTTSQRDSLSGSWGSSEAGTIIWNTTDAQAEVWDGSAWAKLAGGEQGDIGDITLNMVQHSGGVTGVATGVSWSAYSGSADDVYKNTILVFDTVDDFSSDNIVIQNYTDSSVNNFYISGLSADTLYYARVSYYSTRGNAAYSGITTFNTVSFTSSATNASNYNIGDNIIYKWTSSGTFTSSASFTGDILYMAGSGTPGGVGGSRCGLCGAGGVIELADQPMTGGTYTITIGARGSGQRATGSDTTIAHPSEPFVDCKGGGGGGFGPAESYWNPGQGNGQPGGSGGGGADIPYNNPFNGSSSGGSGTPGQGFPGGGGRENQGGRGGGGGKGGSGGSGNSGPGVTYPAFEPGGGNVTLGTGSQLADGVVYFKIKQY